MAGLELTSPSIPVSVRALNGGLNSTASPLNLAPNESSDCQNVDFDKFGSVVKRNGYPQVNTTAFNTGATWTSLHWFEKSDATKYLIGTCGNQFGTWADGSPSGSPTNSTGAVTITAGNNNLFQWTTFLDTALGTNGVDAPIQWAGSGNAAAMVVPTGLTSAYFNEVFAPNSYIFLAHVVVSGTTHRSRLYWSDLNAIAWTATNFNDVARNDGQELTGIKMLGEELIIFKERSIYKAIFTGDRDVPFVFLKTRSNVGCVSGYSIQVVNNGLIFRGTDGFYFFDGNNSYKLSDRITVTLDLYERSRFKYTVSAYQTTKNRYWSSSTTSGGATHNRNVIYDSFNNAWGPYKGLNANCFAIVNISGAERIYFGDYAGFVYRADNGTSDNPSGTATAIDAYYYTPWMPYDDVVLSKGSESVFVYYQLASSTMTFTYAYDFEGADTYSQTFSMAAGGALYGTAVYGTDTYAKAGGSLQRQDLIGRGRVIRLGFKNNVLNDAMQVDGFGVLAHAETAA